LDDTPLRVTRSCNGYVACAPWTGTAAGILGGGDCNDANPAIHPGAVELCNGTDDNCNGIVDDGAYQACVVQWSADKTTCQAALASRIAQLQAQLQTCLAAASNPIQAAACTNAFNLGSASANSVYRSCVNQANLVAWNCARLCPATGMSQTSTRPTLKN
jgi:hypothetical protein